MRYYWDDVFFCVMGTIMAITLVVVIVFGFISVKEFKDRVKRTEASTGCEYVGSPKGVNNVGYFDCNGVIETKRMK
jgi:hypothetical protein